MTWEPVIGLEIHARLLTATKIFCGCRTAFGAPPNTQICPVCLGYPGALPVLNRKAIDLALRMAIATGCEIHSRSIFARSDACGGGSTIGREARSCHFTADFFASGWSGRTTAVVGSL